MPSGQMFRDGNGSGWIGFLKIQILLNLKNKYQSQFKSNPRVLDQIGFISGIQRSKRKCNQIQYYL